MTDTTMPGAPARPTFLTVLCILSFIGGAWALISGTMNLVTPPMDGAIEEMRMKMDDANAEMEEASPALSGLMDGAMDMAAKAAANARQIGISNIVIALLSLFGVWQMWNLKKSGFYLYVLATIAGLAVPLIFIGTNWMAIASVGMGGLVGVVFIVLYGMNLKHMS